MINLLPPPPRNSELNLLRKIDLSCCEPLTAPNYVAVKYVCRSRRKRCWPWACRPDSRTGHAGAEAMCGVIWGRLTSVPSDTPLLIAWAAQTSRFDGARSLAVPSMELFYLHAQTQIVHRFAKPQADAWLKLSNSSTCTKTISPAQAD